ncbi:MAG: NAD-dependent protein deacetylase [Acuticoccus sp.]
MLSQNPLSRHRLEAIEPTMSTIVLHDAADAAAALASELGRARNVVVLTGAGLSTESGIPDFRSPGGIWSRMEPIEYHAFCTSEAARQEDWRRRFEMAALFADAEPNAAHRAIAHLAADGPVSTVITQNIDGLHTRAATPEAALIEIHGTAAHAHCIDCRQRMEIAQARALLERTGAAPRCPACGGFVKAAVVSFGEAMPEDKLYRAQTAATACDLMIAAGTSLVVYPVAALPLMARAAGARLIIMSQAPTEQDAEAVVVIRSSLAATFAAHDRA